MANSTFYRGENSSKRVWEIICMPALQVLELDVASPLTASHQALKTPNSDLSYIHNRNSNDSNNFGSNTQNEVQSPVSSKTR